MIQRLFQEIQNIKEEIKRLRGEFHKIAIGGVIIPTAQSGTASVPTSLLGAIIRGTATGWERLAASAPAAGLRNVLGMDNGDTTPSWKALLDNTNPTTIDIGDSVGPGTSLIAARRDHSHGEGDVVFMVNMAAAL